MRILAVDTATEVCGVAVFVDGEGVTASITSREQTHAQGLMAAIRAVLNQAGIAVTDLDGFAVSRGPGSFTGLRIGISAVKGMVAATGKPLTGVSTLAVLAHQATGEVRRVCPMIDARRSEVYWSVYEKGADGLQPVCAEQAGRPEKVMDLLPGPCLFIGNGARRHASLIQERAPRPVMFADDHGNTLRPQTLALLGMQQLKEGLGEDPQGFSPIYLRKADAKKK